jgi:hypothetical protein
MMEKNGRGKRRTFSAEYKAEVVYHVQWPTRAAARTAIFEYLELYL